jgi:hypothetical protein
VPTSQAFILLKMAWMIGKNSATLDPLTWTTGVCLKCVLSAAAGGDDGLDRQGLGRGGQGGEIALEAARRRAERIEADLRVIQEYRA